MAAQIYYPPGFAESIFAQACVLARTMGLHQARSVPEGISPEEAQERFKVFRSLYLRDKSSSISRGSICWLPSFDCSLPSELWVRGPADSNFTARNQLAGLQDEAYRLLHSPMRSSAEYKETLLHIEHSLEDWANASGVFSSPYAGTRDVDLQLEFLAARICILRKSPEPGHVRPALSASKASCLLVVISFGQHEPSMIEQLDALSLSKSSSESFGRRASRRSSRGGKEFSPESTNSEAREYISSPFHNLLDIFSVPAFFLLVMNLVWPSSTYDESKAEEDLDLLKRTCACFEEINAKIQANNHTRRVGRAFESLLELVKLIKVPQQFQSSHFGIQQSINANNIPSTRKPFGGQNRLPEFSNLPSPSVSLMPPISWERFSNHTSSTTTPDSLSADASPVVLTPMDSFYQPYDPLQRNPFFPHMQQQILQTPSLIYSRTSEPYVSMEDHADPRLISEFLTKNSSTSFGVAP